MPNAVRRVVNEQMDKAIAGLNDKRDPVNGVHTARKTFKRIRSLLRLIQPGLPREFFEKENRRFRDAGRMLSPLRDVHVQREALKELKLSGSNITLAFGQKLSKEEKAIHTQTLARDKALALLMRARKELCQWPLEELRPAHLSCGLRKIYKKVRTSFQTARMEPLPENLHEWRKRTKDFWYAFDLLGKFLPRKMGKLCRRTKKLSDHLGSDHDFFFIGENLRQEALARPRIELHRVERLLAKRRKKLQCCALRIGEKIFDEKPKRFEKRVARRLKSLSC